VQELLDQYIDPEIPAMVKNFNIIYLEMGFSRAPLEVCAYNTGCLGCAIVVHILFYRLELHWPHH
jgi:hypothetical protein